MKGPDRESNKTLQYKDISAVRSYYASVLYSIKRNGLRNKLFLALLAIPASIFGYYYVDAEYKAIHLKFPHEYLIYLALASGIILITIILTINSVSFINSRKIGKIKDEFKKDLFNCICIQIPELKDLSYRQKLHPDVFYTSGLFSSVHTDYIGDDLIQGEYKGHSFELCELHVYRIFKQIFHGLFVRIEIVSGNINIEKLFNSLDQGIRSLEVKHNLVIDLSLNTFLFMAIRKEGKMFEYQNVNELDEDVALLKDVVELVKVIIRLLHSA